MYTFRSYDDIKNQHKIIRTVVDMLAKENKPGNNEIISRITGEYKTACRDFYRRQRLQPIPYDIDYRGGWRCVADNDTRTDFIIIPDKGQTAADIDNFVINSPVYCGKPGYDFSTGRIVTFSWYYCRIPAGIAVVHYCGIDW